MKDDAELLKRLEDAASSVGLNRGIASLWRHKNTDRLYAAVDVGLEEHSLAPVVLYRRVYEGQNTGRYLKFTRPVAEFLERFEQV